MRRCLIICALFLTGCGEKIRTVYAVPHVPADLRQPVEVVCQTGYAARDLALCLLRKDAGLTRANGQIGAVDEILTQAEAKAPRKNGD